MPKSVRRNLNFRQTPHEFRSSKFASIAGRVQRLYPYTRYHTQRIWTLVTKPAKIATNLLGKKK